MMSESPTLSAGNMLMFSSYHVAGAFPGSQQGAVISMINCSFDASTVVSPSRVDQRSMYRVLVRDIQSRVPETHPHTVSH